MASESKESDGADVIVLDDGANNGLNLIWQEPRLLSTVCMKNLDSSDSLILISIPLNLTLIAFLLL